jgi:hypothetical protein
MAAASFVSECILYVLIRNSAVSPLKGILPLIHA